MEAVDESEYPLMNFLTDNQWEDCFNENYRYYKITKDKTTLGSGCISRMLNNDRNVDIGNYTLPEYRKQGVGCSMLIN